jgi:hypothetical protein
MGRIEVPVSGALVRPVDAWRMVQRRAAELGMKVKIGCHTSVQLA